MNISTKKKRERNHQWRRLLPIRRAKQWSFFDLPSQSHNHSRYVRGDINVELTIIIIFCRLNSPLHLNCQLIALKRKKRLRWRHYGSLRKSHWRWNRSWWCRLCLILSEWAVNAQTEISCLPKISNKSKHTYTQMNEQSKLTKTHVCMRCR